MSIRSNLYLEKGWNLVSFYQYNIDFNSIIENKNIIEIKNSLESYNKNIPLALNTLNNIDIKLGYWIKATEKDLIVIEGNLNKKDIDIVLNVGWNLIGYPYNFSTDINKIIKNSILELKTINSNYNSKVPIQLNTLNKLIGNMAYWCKVDKEITLSLTYPFEYNSKDSNNNVSGLVIFDEIFSEELNNNYNKKTFIIKTTDNTLTDIPWINNNKEISYEEIHNISKQLNNIKFTVYYGKLHNTTVTVGINFIDNFPVQDLNIGKIKLIPREYNEDKQYVELCFNNEDSNRILINLTNNNIVYSYNKGYGFIKNLEFNKYILSNNSFTSQFMNDYNLEEINITNIIIKKNKKLLWIKSIKHRYDISKKILELIILTNDNSAIILSVSSLTDVYKSMLLSMNFIDDENIKEQKVVILENTSFSVNNNNSTYNISLNWNGETKVNIKYNPSVYEVDSKYLYWYDLRNVNFNKIIINNKNIFSTYKKIDSNPDYNIFEVTSEDINLRIYLIKSKSCSGCIDVTISYKSINEEEYNFENNYFSVISIYKDTEFKIDELKITINWDGPHNILGYTLKNTSIEKQRAFATILNSYEILQFKNISFKIHYFIGFDKHSINLDNWKSYNEFIKILKELLSFILDYVELYNLRLPLNDGNLEKNGGDPNYDIYITNINNTNIKGYTKADSLHYYTPNPHDVNTYINISCSLNYELLKVVLFHEFFHAIQASYDWFEKSWISEGLAVTFEYILNDTNSLSPKYFISNLLNERNLSLGNIGNMQINSDGYITTLNTNSQDYLLGKVLLEIDKIYSNNEEIEFSSSNIPNIELRSKNDGSIFVEDVRIINKNGKDFLQIILDSNRHYKYMEFYMYVNSKKVTNIVVSNTIRQYGTFAFFYYLIEQYGEPIIKKLLENSIEYNNYDLIDFTIKEFNSSSNFMNELVNFWCAVELMTNNDIVEKKYRLSQSEIWKKYYTKNKNYLILNNINNGSVTVNNLENTGCYITNLVFNGRKACVKIEGNFNKTLLRKKLIIEYQDGNYHIIDIGNNNEFNIDGNTYVYQYKLIIIADVNFPDNESITLSLNESVDEFNPNLMEFKIKVLEN